MAQISLSDLGIRALDENGDTVAGALCYVYDAGTTTPVTTYSDDELTTPNAFPVVANTSGTFPPVFVPDGEYKVDVTDPDDASLSGYPRDNITIGNLLTTRVETLEAEVDALELVDESLDARLDVLELLTPLDEDDFASDSATRPPTQQSAGVYVRTMAGNQSGDAPIYAARAWAKFSTAGGTVSLTESGNVSSITDGGVGVYTVNFTTDIEDVNFATLATATYRGSSALEGATAYTQTVSSVVLRAFEGSGGTAVDPGGMNVAVFR